MWVLFSDAPDAGQADGLADRSMGGMAFHRALLEDSVAYGKAIGSVSGSCCGGGCGQWSAEQVGAARQASKP